MCTVPVPSLHLWRSCSPPGMMWCQCLECPESAASYRQTDLGTYLWLHKPHSEHEIPGGRKHRKSFKQTGPGPWLVLKTVPALARDIQYCQQHCHWRDTTWTWLNEGAERDPARVLTERDVSRKMKGNEDTWKKTDGSNCFCSISRLNVAELKGLSCSTRQNLSHSLSFYWNIAFSFNFKIVVSKRKQRERD